MELEQHSWPIREDGPHREWVDGVNARWLSRCCGGPTAASYISDRRKDAAQPDDPPESLSNACNFHTGRAQNHSSRVTQITQCSSG